MSQDVWSSINPATTSGTQLATLLNSFKNAIMSGLTGTSRPSQTTAGGAWIDTTNEGTPNFYWSFKIYTGSDDIEIFKVNLATSRASISGADSSFEISRVSADSVGPLLEFLKERVANDGQVLEDDIIGEIRFIGAANDDSNPVCATIQVVALEDETSTASGTAVVFSSTPEGQATAAEMMRIQNGMLGIGTASPSAQLHTDGTSGIKSSKGSDDAVGPKIALAKRRISGNGSAQTSDVAGDINFNAQDSLGAENTIAKIEVTATEGQTGTNRGSQIDLQSTTIGAASPTSKFAIGDKILSKTTHNFEATELNAQAVATSATLNQVSAAKRVVEFTGSTATSVRGFNSGHISKVLLIHNRSTANVTLEHENANAAAADRLKLPGSAPITLLAQNSIELYYCTTDTRWKVKSFASSAVGGGGGSLQWNEDDLAPTPSTDAAKNRIYLYDAGLGQALYAAIKVPSAYVAGRPITLKMPVYCGDSSNTLLLQSIATLIRSGTDAISSTTNQRTSTNSSITLGAGTVNIPQMVTFDLTDTTGQINSVAVAADHLILVKLARGTDTATGQLAAMVYAAELSFS